MYWKFESTSETPVDPKYPRPISLWTGLPNNTDGAFEWENKKNYFFKGASYYRMKKGTFEVRMQISSYHITVTLLHNHENINIPISNCNLLAHGNLERIKELSTQRIAGSVPKHRDGF